MVHVQMQLTQSITSADKLLTGIVTDAGFFAKIFDYPVGRLAKLYKLIV